MENAHIINVQLDEFSQKDVNTWVLTAPGLRNRAQPAFPLCQTGCYGMDQCCLLWCPEHMESFRGHSPIPHLFCSTCLPDPLANSVSSCRLFIFTSVLIFFQQCPLPPD